MVMRGCLLSGQELGAPGFIFFHFLKQEVIDLMQSVSGNEDLTGWLLD